MKFGRKKQRKQQPVASPLVPLVRPPKELLASALRRPAGMQRLRDMREQMNLYSRNRTQDIARFEEILAHVQAVKETAESVIADIDELLCEVQA